MLIRIRTVHDNPTIYDGVTMFPTSNLKEFIYWILFVFFLWLVITCIASGLGYGFGILINIENGLFIGAIIVLIVLMILLVFIIRDSNKKTKNNEKIFYLEEKLKENSISVEKKIIQCYLLLTDEKKQLLTRVYNIPYEKDEDIFKCLLKLWNFNTNELYKFLLLFNSDTSSYMINNTLKSNIPKSIVWPVFERDQFICQKCGNSVPKYEFNPHMSYQIYLIRDLSEGGTFSEKNLQTFCLVCHKEENKNFKLSNLSKEEY